MRQSNDLHKASETIVPKDGNFQLDLSSYSIPIKSNHNMMTNSLFHTVHVYRFLVLIFGLLSAERKEAKRWISKRWNMNRK